LHALVEAEPAHLLAQRRFALAAADQQQRQVGLSDEAVEQHLESLVMAEPSHGEQAALAGRPQRCRHSRCFGFAERQRHDHGPVAPACERRARVAIRRRSRDDAVGAAQQRLFPGPIERIGRAQQAAAAVKRDVRMPVHDPGQPPRRRQQQGRECRGVRHVDVQQIGPDAGDAALQLQRERRTQRRIGELAWPAGFDDADGAVHAPPAAPAWRC